MPAAVSRRATWWSRSGWRTCGRRSRRSRGDLAVVPRARPWRAVSERALGDWRNVLGPGPLEELRDIALEASRREQEARGWREAAADGLTVCSLDGTLIRVPDTPANRQAFGSVGTSDDSTPFPQVRALAMNNVSTRALLGMTHGPSGGGIRKAVGEQKLLDQAMEQYRTCSRKAGCG
ncbi:MAG: hypothetical protein ACRDRJ_34060 [Streptosporangiaceae bacterium]